MKRKLGWGVTGLAVVAVGTLLILPMFLGRVVSDQLAGPLQKAFGHPVRFDGSLRLVLFPAPVITLHDVRLDDDRLVVHVPSADLRLRLWPLLAGRLAVQSVVLHAPEVRVTLPAVPWPAAAVASPDNPGINPPPFRPIANEPAIDRILIDNGTLTVVRGAETRVRIEALQLSAALGSLAGSSTVSAAGRMAGIGFTLDMTAPDWAGSETAPATLSLILDQGAGEARLTGQIAGQGTDRAFTGKLSAHLSNDRFASQWTGVPLSIETKLSASATLISASQLAVEAGGIALTGAATLSLGNAPHLAVSLTGERLDLDRLLPSPTIERRGISGDAGSPPPLSLIPDEAVMPGLPDNLSADVDVGAELVTIRGALLRSARVRLSVANGAVDLRLAHVVLPGDTEVQLLGHLHDRRFDGTLQASTNDLRGLAGWLGWKANSVPGDRLHRASLESTLSVTPQQVALVAGHLLVDTSHGEVTATLRRGVRPQFDFALAADALNLDAYSPQGAAVPASAGEQGGVSLMPAVPPEHGYTILKGADWHVKATIGQILFHGVTSRNLSMEARWGAPPTAQAASDRADPDPNAQDQVGNLHLDVGGLAVDVAGSLPAAGSAGLDLRWQAHHPSFAQMLRLYTPDYRPAAASGPFAASARTLGNGSTVSISDLTIAIGPLTATGTGKLTHDGDRPRLEVDLTVGDVVPAAYFPVPVPAVAALTPPAGRPSIAVPPAAGGPAAPLHLRWLNDVDGAFRIAAKSIVIGASRLEAAHLNVSLEGGVATLSPFTARLFGGDFAAKATVGADGVEHAHATLTHGQMKQALADWAGLDVADGVLDASLDLTANGAAPAGWSATLAGQGTLNVHDGHVAGFDLKAVDDRLSHLDGGAGLLGLLSAGIGGGKTAFATLTATVNVDKGVFVNDDMKVSADGGSADGHWRVDLPAETIDGRLSFHLAQAPDAPPLVLRVAGPLAAPRRFLDINPIQVWLAQHAKGSKPKDILKKLLGR